MAYAWPVLLSEVLYISTYLTGRKYYFNTYLDLAR